MNSERIRAILLTLLLVPFFLGLVGTGMHFVPNPSFRWIAASVAATYCAILFAVLFKIAPSRPPDVSDKFPPSIKLALACPVMAYFVYVCFYMSLPAVYT